MISNKTLTQQDIDKIIKEAEKQVANEPVYEKSIKENTELVVLGYNTETKTLEKGILTNNVQ